MEKDFIFGLNPSFEVILSNRRKIFNAFISAKKNPKVNKLIELLRKNDINIKFLDKGELFKMCGSKQHQGIVLETEKYKYSFFSNQIYDKKLLLIDNIEDPHNLGAILRSAEIFGFKNVLLSSKGTPEVYPSVVKVSTGATEHLNISREMSANSYVTKLKEENFKIIVLDEKADTDIKSFIDSGFKDKFALIIGGEDRSVGQFILNSADYIIKMKQHGRINSLNASVAAGIAMYAFSNLLD